MMKFEEKAWSIILSATNKLVDAVKITFGPASQKVIISKYNNVQSLDDGVAIAKVFELENESENAVVALVKTVASKTNDRVGDGTTGSLIMTQAILNEVNKVGDFDGQKISIELKEAADEAKEKLLKKAKKITTKAELEQVAKISFDNPQVAKIIADLVHKTGHDGVVTVQESSTMDITSEVVDGYDFDRGFLSPYMVTNPQRMESIMSNVYIFLTDYKLSAAHDVINIMDKVIKSGKRELVIIAEGIDGDALATLIVNRMQGNISVLGIALPTMSDKQELLSDLAILTGATVVSQEKGDKLEEIGLDVLGKAQEISAKSDKTIILGGKGKKSDIKAAIETLKLELTKEISTAQKERLEKRLAKLLNGVAVIKVGAMTKHEMESLKYKVEDAVNAVKVAYKSGIVCGGGLSLIRLKTSSTLFNKALQEPYKQLMLNSRVDFPQLKDDEAFNIVTGKKGNYLEVGVIDPVEVLIAQIDSAVSIASLLLTSKGILTEVKEPQKEKQAWQN